MIDFRILHLEDEVENVKYFLRTLEVYNSRNNYNIQYENVKNIKEFYAKDITEFDAAIIDIKINNNSAEGFEAIEKMQKMLNRIPSIIYTGTDSQNNDKYVLKTFTKGDADVDEKILDFFVGIHKTGLMNILGGRGQIEQVLSKIYNNNIRNNIKEWLQLASCNPEKTESALLRFVGHCIEDMLHKECEETYPVEMYISPLLNEELAPGLIFVDENNHDKFLIITPACDLALHNGIRKSDTIQLCCIEDIMSCFPGLSGSERNKRKSAIKNQNNMYHYLPECEIFKGGLINFQHIKTIKISEFIIEDFKPIAKITAPYLKNIIARFTNYYARQGQPDVSFDIEEIEHKITLESVIS